VRAPGPVCEQFMPRVGKAVENHVAASSGGWILPFILLLVGIVVVAAFGYMKYRHLVKTHLL
jgi:hypothetical protein